MVESAIARPYSGYYSPIAKKAAALVESAATNHGFTDGNKRTTVILMHLLLSKSGYELNPLFENSSLENEVEEMVLAVVQHQLTFDQIVAWFRARLSKLD